ncbi:MAG: HipA N-terminal domain-containing protein [Bacteroidetes bacterium]|nr:HipA N-terminal domain-containing protein [Bacteroidota bacterium]
MLNWLSKLFKNEEQPELSTPKNAHAAFILKHKKLTIGYLNHSNGIWEFKYSDEFKKQNRIDVLIDFPKKELKYEESYLWPFFSHRIPGLGQPKIQEIIKHEHLNPNNEIDLLRRFGQRSITNPFELALTT